jgi:two-component system cell cycle sensor histidine kinase/response regulator CckA
MPAIRIASRIAHGRLLVIVVFAATLAAAVAHAAPESAAARRPDLTRPLSERQPLVVGVTTDSFPYAYMGDDGQCTGYSVDLLNAVARVMNLRIIRVPAESRVLQQRFRAGEFDFLQALSQTAEREAYGDFSVPYLTLQGALFVRKSATPVQALEDLNGKKFAVIGAGSIGEQFLRDRHLRIEPVYVSSTEDALRRVARGECAATFGSLLTALSAMERRNLRDIQVFGQPFADYDIRHCFVVHKGDTTVLARLNEGLAILQRTGEYNRIYNKWFGRFNAPMISRQQVVNYGVALLAVAFIAVLIAFLHQRALRHRITRQAAELASQQGLLQALYDNIPFSMCVLEAAPEGYRVLSINRQAEPYFGVPPGEATGRLLRELPLHREWADCLGGLLPPGRETKELVREERSLATLHRRLVFTLVPLAPDSTGRARLCLLAEDVTERRNLDDEIAQSRKMRAVGELVGGIAHEFNNLLTPIALKAGQIRLEWPQDQRLHEEIGLIANAVHRAAELTRRLLTFGRKSEVRAEAVRVAPVVDGCFALLRLTADRRINWENAVPPDLPPLYFNPTDLNQIVLNLVLNARDTLLEKLRDAPDGWTPTVHVEGAQIPVGSSPQATDWRGPGTLLGWQRLTVRDNGLGMAPEVRERIFEPFYTTKEVGQGTGLGLSTVWQVVHDCGGRVEVDSAPGQGTAFHVFLPVQPVPVPAAGPPKPQSRSPLGSARILLVEDEEYVAQTVTVALEHAGYSVHHESDGAAAWRHLQERFEDYDLLVLDVNMPGINGLELTRRIRASNRYNGPILVMSGRIDAHDMEQLTAAQVTCVLNKPFDITELQTAVRHSLYPPSTPA